MSDFRAPGFRDSILAVKSPRKLSVNGPGGVGVVPQVDGKETSLLKGE
jgi:hypothetical protein